MRLPDFERDGWRLDDGEERHRAAPQTFHIPDLAVRKLLQPGDYAKLIFEIAVEDDEYPSVERMWVIVRERTANGYVGMLVNQPASVAENHEFWYGTELPFEYRHIISVQPGDAESTAAAKAPVPIPWDRSE
jgi:hypothetical protein